MNITRKELERQFTRIQQAGWLPWFQREARRSKTTTAHLLAIGSRETNLKNIRGDFRDGKYHGYGVMQVDIGTDPEYARRWTPANVEPSIVRGTDIYLSKVQDTKNSVGKTVSVRSRTFVGKAVEADDLRRIATSAYNCGRWAHYHFSKGQHIDTTTTGKDYSRDVYDRSVEFADILEERGIERNAIQNELKLQGKYARADHRRQFGAEIEAERSKLPFGIEQESEEELTRVDYERELTANNDDVQDSAAAPTDSLPSNELDIAEREREQDPPAPAPPPIVQTADAIVNAPQTDAGSTETAQKIAAAQNLSDTEVQAKEKTNFLNKVWAWVGAVVTGTVILPEWLQHGFSSIFTTEALMRVVGLIYDFRYWIGGALGLWFVVNKLESVFIRKKIIDTNTDPTKGNVVLSETPGLFTRLRMAWKGESLPKITKD